MFDVGYGELLLIAIVALLVLGPEKLPGALRTAGLWISRMRRSFDKIRSEIEQEVGADDIRRQIHNELMMDQAREIRREIEAAAQTVKDGVQVPLSDMPGSRSAALARATAAAGEAPAPGASPASSQQTSTDTATADAAGAPATPAVSDTGSAVNETAAAAPSAANVTPIAPGTPVNTSAAAAEPSRSGPP